MTEQRPTQEGQLTPHEVLQAGSSLLAHFDVVADPFEQSDEFRAALQQLDPRYQGDRDLVRWQLEEDKTQWPEDTQEIILNSARRMRMLEVETPLRGDFGVVVALGGARQSNLDRTRYAAQAIKSGDAIIRQLVVAGSDRGLPEPEQQNVANYAPGATTEFDLVAGAAKTVAQVNPGLVVGTCRIEGARIGTPDILSQVLKRLHNSGSLPAGVRVGAVTTQIYQASTELDLARIARQFDIFDTATGGNPSDPNIVAARTPATYLSEVLRTLRAAVNAIEA